MNNRLTYLQLARIAKAKGTTTKSLYLNYARAYAKAAKKEGYAQ